MAPYEDKLETHSLHEDVEGSVNFLLQHADYVEAGQWLRMERRIGPRFDEEAREGVTYGADFSMAEELQAQIAAVRAVRDRIMMRDGSLSTDISTREAKEVISSGSTLLGTLMKYHEKVMNMERLRLLEASVVEALGEVEEELRDQVLGIMDQKLSNLA